MRYKVIDSYQHENSEFYIAQNLKLKSPQYIVFKSLRTLCKGLDIVNVNNSVSSVSWATGEDISLAVHRTADCLDKLFELES